jgi:hypothetical protein
MVEPRKPIKVTVTIIISNPSPGILKPISWVSAEINNPSTNSNSIYSAYIVTTIGAINTNPWKKNLASFDIWNFPA